MADIDDYADVLGEPQRRVWAGIARIARSRGGVLMGGTAVALHLRHRLSDDLDVVTLDHLPGFDVAEELEKDFANVEAIPRYDGCRALVDGVRVDMFAAPRRSTGRRGICRVAAGGEVCGMPVASLPDLLATKLEVITARAKLRDYIDLYAIDTLTRYTLGDWLGFYCRRFGHDTLPDAFGDTITRLSDPQDLPDDPQFDHLRDEALAHLSRRAVELRAHLASQFRPVGHSEEPAPSPARRSQPAPLNPPPQNTGG